MTVYADKDLPLNWLPPASTIWPTTQQGRLAIAARKQAEAEEEQAKQIRERQSAINLQQQGMINSQMNQLYGQPAKNPYVDVLHALGLGYRQWP